MHRLFIFVFRVILGVIFAIILMRIFYPQAGVGWTAVAAAALVALAYITENLRKRNRNPEGNGSL